jgi:membrane-bound ClpP family serine protease
MCHFLLLLPLAALPVFWIVPLAVALPVYGAVLALSAAIYWYAILAMRRPVQTGAEGMVGEIGEVIESRGANLFVRARSEIWHAESAAPLREGDRVRVVAVEQLTLRVQKLEMDARYSREGVMSPSRGA